MRIYAADVDPLAIRRVLGRADWSAPTPRGLDSWVIARKDRAGMITVSVAPYDGADWIHASISWRDRMPSYDDLALMHRAVYGQGHAYQVFVPPAEHYSFHEYCLHLWGRLDGARALPDFAGPDGTV